MPQPRRPRLPTPGPGSFVAPALAVAVSLAGACAPPPPDPPRPTPVPVRGQVVEPGTFQPRLTVYGRVEPSARVELRVTAAGTLRYPSRFASGLRDGETVAAGEVLFFVENENANLALAEARLEVRSAEAELERTRTGVEAGFLSVAELRRREIAAELAQERLAGAEKRLQRLQGRAPVEGHLKLERVFPAGAEVAAGELLAQVTGNGALQVEAWATAADLADLRPGLEAHCRAPGSEPDGPLVGVGRLRELGREVETRGTVRLRVTITEDLDMPPPGEGLELDVLLGERERALTVPETAVVTSRGASSVFVLETQGRNHRAERRFVRLGKRGPGQVEIVEGLVAGERIAVEGVELLTDGALAVDAGDAGDGDGGSGGERDR